MQTYHRFIPPQLHPLGEAERNQPGEGCQEFMGGGLLPEVRPT
jgi:hypothetical protein